MLVRSRRLCTLATVFALAMAVSPAASGGSVGSQGGGSTCPVKALKKGEAVEITFWHQLTAENEVVLEGLVAAFEAEHPDISVRLVNQTTYVDLFEKYTAGLETGDLPDVGQFEDTTIQQLVDSQSTIAMQSCVKADKYSLKDFLPRTLAFYTTEGTLRSMPFNISNPVLFFNRTAAIAAGIDPDEPPETFDALREYSQKIIDAGAARHGMALHVEPYVNEFLFAKSGLEYVNNENGRKARATKSVLASKGGVGIWTWWRDMVESGLAVNTGATPGSTDHLFALGTGDAAMTFEASAALGPAYAVLSSGQFPGVELGVWPLPALKPGGGVPVGDGSLWIPKASSPEKQAAAWQLVKFLAEPSQVAALSVGSQGGYIPTRRSTLDDPALEALWAERPFLRVPYDQLAAGPNNATTAGPVIGDYQGVREAVRGAFVRMLTQGLTPKVAIRQAQDEATAAIREYNERVGAG